MEEFLSDGVTIAYVEFEPREQDRNEPIVLIHGFASTHAVNWLFNQWAKTLTEDGRKVVMFDLRGHGASQKLYEPEAYGFDIMAQDTLRLLDHLGIERGDILGYSMGGRIGTHLALAHPERVRSLIMGGVGTNLLAPTALLPGMAEAMEANEIQDIEDHSLKIFRGFAESTRSDLKALAACARGVRPTFAPQDLARVETPTLICAGTRDDVAGDPHPLGKLFKQADVVDIPGRDHNRAVGDRVFKQAVLEFLAARP
jgi:pimeloyl-ACP methyl ester carboxylesterase